MSLNSQGHESLHKSPEDAFNEIFTSSDIVKKGHFELAAGEHSDTYLDVKGEILENPEKLKQVAKIIAEMCDPSVEIFVGPANGGNILAEAVAEAFMEMHGELVEFIPFEKDENEDQRIPTGDENRFAGRNVIILEDVVTSGGTVENVVNLVGFADGTVIQAIALINRNIDPNKITVGSFGNFPFHVLKKYPIQTYKKSDMPEWLRKIPKSTEYGR